MATKGNFIVKSGLTVNSTATIGNGSAATSLYVYGNVSGSNNSYVRLTDTSGSSLGFAAVLGGTTTVNIEGGSGNSYLNGGGNLGIGTSSPAYKLDVSGNARVSSDVRTPNYYAYNSAGNYSGLGFYDSVSLTTRYAVLETQIGTQTVLKTDGATPLLFGTNASERMRIDSSGNIGIGTSSPTSGKLVINGTSVTTSQGIRLVGDTADARFICESATLGAGILGTFSNHSQLFYTNSTERMRIDSSGRVTMPSQPYFSARHSNNTTTTGNIIWTSVDFNNGGYYNTANGRFTAPVAGLYYFKTHTLISNASQGEVRIAFQVNGANWYGGLNYITQKPVNAWFTIMAEGHIYLNAGDYVTVNMIQNPGTLYGDPGYNAFSGHLVC